MIGLPANTRIYLCTTPVDFRKGFDGLTGVVTESLGQKVTDGSLFLFVNRKQDRIKALWWETGGLTLWYRRLEQGTVEYQSLSDYMQGRVDAHDRVSKDEGEQFLHALSIEQ